MTPTQTMMKFDKKTPVSTHLYGRLQDVYLSGIIKDGLFANSSVLERECDLMQSTQSTKRQLMVSTIFLFSVWRNNKSIFKFDEDLARQIVSARVPPDLKASVLQRLPHWAVYIELPRAAKRAFIDGSGNEGHQVLGFWAVCDKDSTTNKDWLLKLYIHVDSKGNEDCDLSMLHSIDIPISSNLTVNKCTLNARWNTECLSIDKVARNIEALNTMIGLLLYLCVDDPDVMDVIGLKLTRQQLLKPRYKHVKTRKVFEPSIQPHYYDVGVKEANRWREEARRLENNIMAGRSDMDGYIADGQWCISSSETDVGIIWEGGKIS